MKTDISAAIRRFIEEHIVADDPYPERSRLDRKDFPPVPLASPVAMAGLPVEPLPPLPQRFGHGVGRRALRRIWAKHRSHAHHADGEPSGGAGGSEASRRAT